MLRLLGDCGTLNLCYYYSDDFVEFITCLFGKYKIFTIYEIFGDFRCVGKHVYT